MERGKEKKMVKKRDASSTMGPHVIYFLLLLLLPSKINIQRERLNKQTTNIIHGPLFCIKIVFFFNSEKRKEKPWVSEGFFFPDVGVWAFFKNEMCFPFHQPFFSLIYYFDFSFSFFFSLIFSSFFFFWEYRWHLWILGKKKRKKKRKYGRMEEKKGFFFCLVCPYISFLFSFLDGYFFFFLSGWTSQGINRRTRPRLFFSLMEKNTHFIFLFSRSLNHPFSCIR